MSNLDPIDEFVDMCMNTKDIGSLKVIIQQVLSHPNIFAGFSELLAVPNVSSSFSSTSPNFLQTIELFAFGTIKDYTSSEKGYYLDLNSTQVKKLQQLTVVSLVRDALSNTSSRPCQISYSVLLSAIYPQQFGESSTNHNIINYSTQSSTFKNDPKQLDAIRELENVLVSCIYSNLLSGKLDHRNVCFKINSSTNVISRDVPLSSILPMKTKLENWKQNSLNSACSALQRMIDQNQETREKDKQFMKRVQSSAKRTPKTKMSSNISGVRNNVHGEETFDMSMFVDGIEGSAFKKQKG